MMSGKDVTYSGISSEPYFIPMEGDKLRADLDDTLDAVDDDMSNLEIESVEKFINERFCNIVIDRIKSEIHEELMMSGDCSGTNVMENASRRDDRLVESLQNQVVFLQQELLSRNKIIELMIKESLNIAGGGNNKSGKVANGHTVSSARRETLTAQPFKTNRTKPNRSLSHRDPIMTPQKRKNNRVATSTATPAATTTKGNSVVELSNRFDLLNSTVDGDAVDDMANESSSSDATYNRDEKAKKGNKKKEKAKRKCTNALADSLMKEMQPKNMISGMIKERTFIKSISGSITPYSSISALQTNGIQSVLQNNADLILLHRGANELRNEKLAKQIALNIVNLAETIKNGDNDVIILGIVPRGDAFGELGIQAVNSALRSGGPVETSKKFGGGGNKQHMASRDSAAVCRDTEETKHETVPLDVGKIIMKGRNEKGMTQKDLATRINEKPQVINDYEAGRAIPNNQIMSKIERAIGMKLRGVDKGKPLGGPKSKK